MTQTQMIEVLGTATLNENLLLLIVVLSLIGIAVGLTYGIIVLACWVQDVLSEGKQAVEESALWYEQGPLPVPEMPAYDGTSIWAQWSKPYVPQPQPVQTAASVANEELLGLSMADKVRFVNELSDLGWSEEAIIELVEEYGWE